MPLSCCGAVGQWTSVCRFKSVPTLWLCGPIDACAARWSPARIFVLLLSSLSMLSGEIYLRLKPYLVVKISSDIVTEHCCQVCVLFMMFCRSDCRLCADMVVSYCATIETRCTAWFDTPTGQRGIRKILFAFDFPILPWQRYIGVRIIPCRCISIKKILCVDSSRRARDTAAMLDHSRHRGESATKTVKFFVAHTVNCVYVIIIQ